MADIKDFLGEGAAPVALGVGAILLAPSLLPAIGRVARPIAKGVIKTGISVYREACAGLSEAAGDLVAEARAELDAESQPASEAESQPASKAKSQSASEHKVGRKRAAAT